ncbi:hypothetical protein AB4Z09_20240 [Rhodococcus sp. TAF43]|jgi:hypothetical protein|uniref:hypothetical protein n=1 Tax=unclassified Rhodococcus (in: high G+C Gram-positive bacteria) TaxID=192944 RepID=UPI000E0C5462|nr:MULTISPECIES: hypothetical protein [unclassified Rhodococcus (in: high G+C Gram-positive bacteria)]QKT10680.1 hypothetical protein HUN07_08070 [Rhodococcus sp. W8901]RDI35836.1 hypothetical protein DEU38_101316 [Rhodococcus sp. AG1013]
MIVIGLIILIAAVVVGVAGVLSNGGVEHALTDDFSVLGYHVTGSTGALFLCGIVVGAVGFLGLGLVLTGARRASRRGRAARNELEQSRRNEAALTQERDQLAATGTQTTTARHAAADTTAEAPAAPDSAHTDGERSWKHPFGGGHQGPPASPRPAH